MADAQPLLQALSLTLDGSGAGTVRLGPVPGFQQWEASLYTVQVVTPGLVQATVKVYRNVVADGSLIDGTYAGNFDTSTQSPPIILSLGESLFFVFSGGNPGSAAKVRVEGVIRSQDSLSPDL